MILDIIFNIAKGVQHDGRLPFWKPASVFVYYVCIVTACFGEYSPILVRSGHKSKGCPLSLITHCAEFGEQGQKVVAYTG